MDANLVRQSWIAGATEWKLDPNQREIDDLLEERWSKSRIHVLNMARQNGKSTYLVNLCDRIARRIPGARIKYAAETAKQVRAIIRPHFHELLKDCPQALRPVFNTMDGEYRYPNGSTITIGGCETEEDANKLLGQHAHLFIIDEAGSLTTLNYVVKVIAGPQTLNTGGRIIITSTPAKTPDHPFYEYCKWAEDRGVLIERTIYEHQHAHARAGLPPRISDSDIAEMMELCGGEDSTEWKREYLVQHVTDQDRQILKFATKERVQSLVLKIDEQNPLSYRPDAFDAYAGYDMGWAPDATGALWGYYDYAQDAVVFENELFMRRMDTKTLATNTELAEKELYGSQDMIFQRWADMDPRLAADLMNDHQLLVHRTSKDNLDAAINSLNLMVAGLKHRVFIHPRCQMLIEQLYKGIWDKNRKKFARSVKHGHYDLLAAAIYFTRNVQFGKIPERFHVAVHARNVLVIEEPEETGLVQTFRGLLGFD